MAQRGRSGRGGEGRSTGRGRIGGKLEEKDDWRREEMIFEEARREQHIPDTLKNMGYLV